MVPGATSATSSDDIASLVAYRDQNGSSIGVLWSNHNSPSSMYFAYHKDGDPDTTWAPIEQIYARESAAPPTIISTSNRFKSDPQRHDLRRGQNLVWR